MARKKKKRKRGGGGKKNGRKASVASTEVALRWRKVIRIGGAAFPAYTRAQRRKYTNIALPGLYTPALHLIFPPPFPHGKLHVSGVDTRYVIASLPCVRFNFSLSATLPSPPLPRGRIRPLASPRFFSLSRLTLYAVFRGFYWKEWGHLKMGPESFQEFRRMNFGWDGRSRRPRWKARLRGVSFSLCLFFFFFLIRRELPEAIVQKYWRVV